MALLDSVTIVTIVTTSAQQVYAPRGSNGCSEFKKMTSESEKAVLDAAIGNPELIPGLLEQYNPELIPGLLEQYNRDILELFETPSNITLVN
jgi:hypothetical protein